jgi:hypothetical protein
MKEPGMEPLLCAGDLGEAAGAQLPAQCQ